MILVYTAPSIVLAAHVRNLLEAEGIACTLRNEFLGSAAGKIPANECWPEVWVVDAAQADRARAIVAEASLDGEPARTPGWRCSACGEQVEGQFAQCWNCGALCDE